MQAEVLPANATLKAVTWSVTPGSGTATISGDGELTAGSDGTVTVVATSNATSAVVGQRTITLSSGPVLPTSIVVTSKNGATTITASEKLQMYAEVLPTNATNKAVTWSVTPGIATISAEGELTAVSEGVVTVTATSVAAGAVVGEKTVTITSVVTKSLKNYSPVVLSNSGGVVAGNVQYLDASSVIRALPSSIEVVLEDDTSVTIPLTWSDTSTYSATTAGSYMFRSTWGTLPANIDNSDGLEAPSTSVVVAP